MEVMETGIYEILNTKNGKWYRGQAAQQSFEERWYGHRYRLNRGEGVNQHLQNAWNKYGEEAFMFSVLEECPPELCNEREEWWIGDDYKRTDISYNKQAGGDGGSHSEETRQKISEGNKRHWADPEARRKQSETLRNSWSCPEKRLEHSEAQKIAQNRPEVKRKKSEAMKIACSRPEVKRRKSEAQRRPEWILKQRQALGKPFTCTHPDGRVTSYLSTHEAAKELGVSSKTIHNYLEGITIPGSRKPTAHLKGCVFTYCEQ